GPEGVPRCKVRRTGAGSWIERTVRRRLQQRARRQVDLVLDRRGELRSQIEPVPIHQQRRRVPFDEGQSDRTHVLPRLVHDDAQARLIPDIDAVVRIHRERGWATRADTADASRRRAEALDRRRGVREREQEAWYLLAYGDGRGRGGRRRRDGRGQRRGWRRRWRDNNGFARDEGRREHQGEPTHRLSVTTAIALARTSSRLLRTSCYFMRANVRPLAHTRGNK